MSKKKKILLLNPPATQIISRDYYCGHLAKSDYSWPPFDLLVISGLLNDPRFEVFVRDAIAEELSASALQNEINKIQPDYIVGLIAEISYEEDKQFYHNLKKQTKSPLFLSGDCARSDYEKVQHEVGADGIILHFAINNLKAIFLQDNDNEFQNIYVTDPCAIMTQKNSQSIQYGIPLHEIFPLKRYQIPHGIKSSFTVVGSDFSCPHRCSFCYFEKIPYSQRTLHELKKELEYVQELNIQEILLADASFGLNEKRALEICALIENLKKKISWICEIRADCVTPKLLAKMKRSGCHTVMIGIESYGQKTLDRVQKKTSISQICSAVNTCKKNGLKVLGHFIIGFPWESETDILDTIKFSLSLNIDIASFNIYRQLSNSSIAKDSEYKLPASEIIRLQQNALRLFYLRPSYIIKQLLQLKTFIQLKKMSLEALRLICKNKQ